MSSAVSYPHIILDNQGVARIGHTRYKILHLAGEYYHYGWLAEELLRQHPDLRPEEVYAPLTYFYDHNEALVQQIHEQVHSVESQRSQQRLSRAELFQNKH